MSTFLSPSTHFRAATLLVPSDKSLSHRALIFAALARGRSRIRNLSASQDVQNTRACLELLGVSITHQIITNQDNQTFVTGGGFHPTSQILDCGNSGTTMRLLMGVLSAFPYPMVLTGDPSLSKRPMNRIANPLRQMGATIELRDGEFSPVRILGTQSLSKLEYNLPIASAQLKSALLLAGISAQGETKLCGKTESRDHTERLLRWFGVTLECGRQSDGGWISVRGPQVLRAADFDIPGDPSSAAYWAALASLIPGARLEMKNVLLNPFRTGFFQVLQRMGADLTMEVTQLEPEPVGTVRVAHRGSLSGVSLSPEEIPSLIDELPLLGIVGAFAEGETRVVGAEELRVKETDRIQALALGLQALGGQIETFSDGFSIRGRQVLRGGRVDSFGDHRIAMSFAVAACAGGGDRITEIQNPDCVAVSYPRFFEDLKGVLG